MTQTIAPSRASEVVSVRGQGLSLAVRRFEGGAGAPLLLLHGVSSSSTSWQPIADRFGSSWRISAPDLRGHGMSDHDTGGYRFDALRSDVARVLADIGEPAVVVGHSLGGIVAMHLAQGGHPLVRAVFLEDPPVYTISPFVLSCTSFGPLFHALRNAVIQMQAAGEPVSAYRDLLAGSKHPSGGTQGEHMCPDALWSRAESLSRMDPDAFDAILDGRSSGGFRSDRPLRCPAMLVRADPGLGAAFGEEHERLLATTSPRVVVNALSGSHNLRGDRQTRESYLGLLTEFLDSLP